MKTEDMETAVFKGMANTAITSTGARGHNVYSVVHSSRVLPKALTQQLWGCEQNYTLRTYVGFSSFYAGCHTS